MPNRRKPNEQHMLDGTYRKDRHGTIDEQVIIDESVGSPPDYLDKIATKEWRRVVSLLDELNVLRATDRTALGLYCSLVSEHQRLRDQFTNSRMSQLRGILKELGLTPVSRSNVRATPNKKGSKFDNI